MMLVCRHRNLQRVQKVIHDPMGRETPSELQIVGYPIPRKEPESGKNEAF